MDEINLRINPAYSYPTYLLQVRKDDLVRSIDLLLKLNNGNLQGEIKEAYDLAIAQLNQVNNAIIVLNSI